MTFNDFNLSEELLNAIDYMGFKTPTPIQEFSIPVILNNEDLIACAQTGTGKTAAFVLPILNKLIHKKDTNVDTLILVPTRELAIQIEQQIQGLSYFISVGSIAIYGGGDGKNWDVQKSALVSGTDIIVATPGKLISHLKMGYVKFDHVKHFVLDEADRMLDMGFSDDIHKIISYLPENRQTLLFSATMPNQIRTLANKILKSPQEISLSISKPAEGVAQFACLVNEEFKEQTLKMILSNHPDFDRIIIFTSVKTKVNSIVRFLRKNNFNAEGISSDLEQNEREQVLLKFRSKELRILVATDVMSRGIDIKEINLVINYDVPHDAEDYVHRVGRTARANTTGTAYTLVSGPDVHKLQRIERLIENEIPKYNLPEELGPFPSYSLSMEKPKSKKKFFKKKKTGNNSKPIQKN